MQERHAGPIDEVHPSESDPVVEAYKRHIDRTLLRQNLRRTVTERVKNLIASLVSVSSRPSDIVSS